MNPPGSGCLLFLYGSETQSCAPSPEGLADCKACKADSPLLELHSLVHLLHKPEGFLKGFLSGVNKKLHVIKGPRTLFKPTKTKTN